jgi:regulator of replication initiation timing
MKTAAPSVELEPIDRLEEKLKRLVEVVERLKAEHARSTTENARLAQELDAAKARLDAGESAAGEAAVLRQERDLIRSRVGEMLEQLDALNL